MDIMYNQSAFDADKRALKSQEQINDDTAQDIAAEKHAKQLEDNRRLFSGFGRCKGYWNLSPQDRMREDIGSKIDWVNDTRSER